LAFIGGEAAKEGGRIRLFSGAILADQGCVDNGWPLRLIFFFQQKWTMSFHDGNQLILTPIIPSWKEHER
jgi:hypothetical protein